MAELHTSSNPKPHIYQPLALQFLFYSESLIICAVISFCHNLSCLLEWLGAALSLPITVVFLFIWNVTGSICEQVPLKNLLYLGSELYLGNPLASRVGRAHSCSGPQG